MLVTDVFALSRGSDQNMIISGNTLIASATMRAVVFILTLRESTHGCKWASWIKRKYWTGRTCIGNHKRSSQPNKLRFSALLGVPESYASQL